MKRYLLPASIVALLLLAYMKAGWFIPGSASALDDPDPQELRQRSLKLGLGAVPEEWSKAARLADRSRDPIRGEEVALGERLFFDPILSRDESLSCASCHVLSEGGDDNRPTAVGYHGLTNPFHLNSPTVLNAAMAKRQFWDGRSPNVEDQAKGPIQAPFEMAMTPEETVRRLRSVPDYAREFERVYPGEGVSFETVTRAIGAFERTLLTRGAFDRFLEGDDEALSKKALRGLDLFIRIGCKGCHTGVSVGGQSLQRFPLRPYNGLLSPVSYYGKEGRRFAGFVWQRPRDEPYPFEDLGGFRGRNGDRLFRVPVLRNVTRTAPYFHNGAVEEIEEAVRIMARHQLGLTLERKQVEEIVAFLKSLEGEIVGYEVP